MKDQSTVVFFTLIALSCISFASANPCAGLWLGEKVPHSDYCYKFYSCYLTLPHRRSCPHGKIFDSEARICVYGNRETCEIYGTETTTTETTTTTTTTTTPPPPTLDEICEGVFFAARPYRGSQEYFVGCIREQGILFTCFEGEEFSPITNECVKV